MDFWGVYKDSETQPVFGHSRMRLGSRDRIHVSNSAIDSCCLQLERNTGLMRRYSEAERYIVARGLTYDLLVSVYDVNTSCGVALRISAALSEIELARVLAAIRSLKRPNLEMRIIGLQNGAAGPLSIVNWLGKRLRCSLMEADLFGIEARNVAFDLKQGMTFDVLLSNRMYAKGELVNRVTKEEFEAQRSEFKLV